MIYFGKRIKMRVLIEGILITIFGLAALAEGVRLIIYKDPYVFYDPIGPGFYILALGTALMTVGIAHFIVNYRRLPVLGKMPMPISGGMRMKLFSSFMVLAIYIYLLDFIGYLVATFVFFVLEFRVAGVTSWRSNLILAFFLSALYYVVFAILCEIVFPKGILF
jgi:putative tricarboxylic transport membrane protein